MRSFKICRSYVSHSALCVFLIYSSCASIDRIPDPASVEHWILGTSVSIREDFSAETFKPLKEAGIDYVELGLRAPQFYADSSERGKFCLAVKEAASESEVLIWSIHIPYGREWDISDPTETIRQEVLKKHLRLFEIFEILEPEKAVIHPSFEPNPPVEREARFEACRKSLAILAAEADRYGVELVIENLPRTCLGNSSEEILRLLDGYESLGVCCDVNHLLSEAPQEFIKNIGKRITTLHISDYDGIDERHWPPGQGIIEWNLVLESLLTAGYPGPFLLEYGDSPENKAAMWEELKSQFIRN